MSEPTTTPPTTGDQAQPGKPAPRPRRENAALNKLTATLQKLGLGFFVPFIKLAAGDSPKQQLREITLSIALPSLAILAFGMFWVFCSQKVQTDSQKIPSPSETWAAYQGMRTFAANEAQKAKEFRGKMEKLALNWEERAAKAQAAGKTEDAARFQEKAESSRSRTYAGPPTFNQQILVSLITIAVGFFTAALIAVPVGILCGLSKGFNTAVNPLIQVFKPISPMAWLPIVFVVVTFLYTPPDGATIFGRALFISAGTVTLCCLWPTLINTAVGVANVDKDHLNVARVLRLDWFQRIWKIILPSALPMIFTGLRLSLGVGWMVLIAADMLAQNSGLGKFVWDTFQNGSSESMAQIMVAVFTIGLIGFVLDRIMLVLQKLVSFDEHAI